MIGLDSSDTDFDTAEETGGSKTRTLESTNLPAHTHHVAAITNAGTAVAVEVKARVNGNYDGNTNHNSISYDGYNGQSNSGGSVDRYLSGTSHSHQVNLKAFDTDSTGTSTAFSILNPYITVYMWKRVS